MHQVADNLDILVRLAVLTGTGVTLIRVFAWLLGLVLVLRDSRPAQRPAILRAYAMCWPPNPPAPGESSLREAVTHAPKSEPAA